MLWTTCSNADTRLNTKRIPLSASVKSRVTRYFPHSSSLEKRKLHFNIHQRTLTSSTTSSTTSSSLCKPQPKSAEIRSTRHVSPRQFATTKLLSLKPQHFKSPSEMSAQADSQTDTPNLSVHYRSGGMQKACASRCSRSDTSGGNGEAKARRLEDRD